MITTRTHRVLILSAMAALLVIVISLAGEPAFAAEKSYTSLSASGSVKYDGSEIDWSKSTARVKKDGRTIAYCLKPVKGKLKNIYYIEIKNPGGTTFDVDLRKNDKGQITGEVTLPKYGVNGKHYVTKVFYGDGDDGEYGVKVKNKLPVTLRKLIEDNDPPEIDISSIRIHGDGEPGDVIHANENIYCHMKINEKYGLISVRVSYYILYDDGTIGDVLFTSGTLDTENENGDGEVVVIDTYHYEEGLSPSYTHRMVIGQIDAEDLAHNKTRITFYNSERDMRLKKNTPENVKFTWAGAPDIIDWDASSINSDEIGPNQNAVWDLKVKDEYKKYAPKEIRIALHDGEMKITDMTFTPEKVSDTEYKVTIPFGEYGHSYRDRGSFYGDGEYYIEEYNYQNIDYVDEYKDKSHIMYKPTIYFMHLHYLPLRVSGIKIDTTPPELDLSDVKILNEGNRVFYDPDSKDDMEYSAGDLLVRLPQCDQESGFSYVRLEFSCYKDGDCFRTKWLSPRRMPVVGNGSYTAAFDVGEYFGYDQYAVTGITVTNHAGLTATYSADKSSESFYDDPEFWESLQFQMVPDLEHDYRINEGSGAMPTCMHEGYGPSKTCTRCGKYVAGDQYEELGHEYDEGVVTKKASTSAVGKILYTCQKNTKHKFVEKIPKLKLTVKASKSSFDLKAGKASQTIKDPIKVSGAKTTVSYKKTGGEAGFKVNTSTGALKVTRKMKAGTYKVTIKVSTASNRKYEAASKKVTLKIIMK